MKIIVLYSRLAGYWMTGMRKFIELYGGEFIVFRDVNSIHSPFEFQNEPGIRLYDASALNKEELLQFCIREKPDSVYVCGWSNRKYLRIAEYFKKRNIPTVCGIDNPFTNSPRQRIGMLFLRNVLHKSFSHVWIPGDFQLGFVKRLGFGDHQIIKNLYSADLDLFLSEYEKNRLIKAQNFPHRFIYVGRYLTIKGVRDLWEAFIQLQNENGNEWELWCLGTGDLYESRPGHPKIHHFGFVQPVEIPKYIPETGVFIMPSHFDHWGVAVHEFAAAGYPLICSDNVGASTLFLIEGRNGFIHQAGNIESLKNTMRKIIACSDEDLVQMGDYSVRQARLISPEVWAKSLMKIMEGKNITVNY